MESCGLICSGHTTISHSNTCMCQKGASLQKFSSVILWYIYNASVVKLFDIDIVAIVGDERKSSLHSAHFFRIMS
eukprot:m.346492 g.346492  ORF g.346492 m.346492 type:complete len:75 (+) comp29391_c0_seq1:692-916(+)